MIVREGKISLIAFVVTAALILALSIPASISSYAPHFWGPFVWGPLFYYALVNMVFRLILGKTMDFEVSSG